MDKLTFESFGEFLLTVREKTRNKQYEGRDGGYLIPETVDVPKNKWQELRRSYLPWFILRIFPVKTKTINLIDTMKIMAKQED